MPELPEVETIRRQIEPVVVGTTITDAWSFGTPKFEQAGDAVDHRITSARRRGKYLILGLRDVRDPDTNSDDRELVIHLGMTGRLSVGRPDDTVCFGDRIRPTHRRVEWMLDGSRILEFTDIRRFGRIAVVRAGDYTSLPTLDRMGPEPFDPAFDAERLRSALMGSTRMIKTQLMSQQVVAGLGNIYVDESLWLARIHPESRRVTRPEAERLRDAIVTTLQSGLVNGGTTLRDYRDVSGKQGANQARLECYGREGLPCRRCGRELKSARIGGRTTTFCSHCQRRRL